MSNKEIGYNKNQKCEQFDLDAKTYLSSLKEAIDYVKESSFQKVSKNDYISETKSLIEGLKNNFVNKISLK
jgi:hypothetical protein